MTRPRPSKPTRPAAPPETFYETMPTMAARYGYHQANEPYDEDHYRTESDAIHEHDYQDESRLTAIITIALALIIGLAMIFLIFRGLEAVKGATTAAAMLLPLT